MKGTRLFGVFPALIFGAVAVALCTLPPTIAYSSTVPSTFYLGGIFPLFRKPVGKNFSSVRSGVERMASLIAAVNAVNADTSILPHTTIKYVVKNNHKDEGYTVEAGVELLNGESKVGAVIGPATSTNTKISARVFNPMGIPQISYSATSPSLSNSNLYKYFLRTPPHDLFQANIIVDFLEDEVADRGIFSFSLLVGPGSYAESIGKLIQQSYNYGGTSGKKLQLHKAFYFRDDDNDLEKQMDDLLTEDKRGCHVYVLSAQASDMQRVFSIAKQKGITGNDRRAQWIMVESAKASYTSLRGDMSLQQLNEIIQGSVVISPPDGAGTSEHDSFKSKLRSLGTLGTPCEPTHDNNYCFGLNSAQCSDAVDANNESIWYHTLPTDTTDYIPRKICLAMDMSNYQPTLYMPYAWDAVWAIAKGLHQLLEKNQLQNKSTLCTTKVERGKLYEELIDHVSFAGATGTVDFLNQSTESDGAGDRDGYKFTWSISVHTENGFVSYGTVKQKQFRNQADRVPARTAAHSTSDSSLPPLCYPGKNTGNGQSIIVSQDPLPIILVSIAAFVIIVALVVAHYLHNKRLRDAHSDAWKIDKSQLNIIKTIGKGAYGTVYLGTYNSTSVAIKRFEKKTASQGASIDDFIAEFEAIVDLRHQNLVQFFGVVLEPTTLQHSIVTELMEKGDLTDVLHDPENEFTSLQLASFAHQVSLGLEYLHQQKPNAIVHCDLKTENILVDEHFVCKIADFGLTTVTGANNGAQRKRSRGSSFKQLSFGKLSPKKDKEESAKGSMLWLPPEVYSGSTYTTAGDVFALGLIFSEICSLRSPFSEIEDKSTNQIQREVAMFNLRPHWKSGQEAFPALKDVFNLATEMWCEDANDRLNATDVCKRLVTVLESLKNNKENKPELQPTARKTYITKKSQKGASNSEMIETSLKAEKKFTYFPPTDVEIPDTKESNKISGSKFHQLKSRRLKGGKFVSMLSITFRLGKKEKRIRNNVKKIVNDLKSLASIQHKNLSPFLGATSLQSTTVGMVFSMALEYDTLSDYVVNKGLSMKDGILMAVDVVRALMHLHNKGYSHCQLSSHTIMINTKTKNVLLYRWERTIIQCKIQGDESMVRGLCGWQAPEALMLDHNGKSCDVYAVGILLWYIMAKRTPFEDMLLEMAGDTQDYMLCDRAEEAVNRKIVNEKIRPNIQIQDIENVSGLEDEDHTSYIDIISGCWSQKMDDRIDLGRVLNFLNAVEFPLETLPEVSEKPHTEISVMNPLFVGKD